jgi:hypothetical protein
VTKTISQLVAGDKVAIIFHHWGRSVERITTVSRVTKTQIITDASDVYDGRKWRIQDGHEFGDRHSSSRIEVFTRSHQEEIDEQELRTKLFAWIEAHPIRTKTTTDVLLRVAQATGFSEAQPEESL